MERVKPSFAHHIMVAMRNQIAAVVYDSRNSHVTNAELESLKTSVWQASFRATLALHPKNREVKLKRRVMFLCGRNDSLGSLAAAFLRHVDSHNFEAFSINLHTEDPHPLSIDVMREVSISPEALKPVEDLQGEVFDFVITMDELSARQSNLVAAGETVHWKFENPLSVSDNPKLQRRAFQSVRDQIAQRVRLFAIVHARNERVIAPRAAHQASAIS
jgi:ArsR family transcriptional regulator, arsenate/arsenite/antimonite-responsive transcriptional repressor / arsenate reductase (thioredoxin)